MTKECLAVHGARRGLFLHDQARERAGDQEGRESDLRLGARGRLAGQRRCPRQPGDEEKAFGHVTLDFATRSGIVTFSGGTGRFRGFHARVAVTYSTDDGLWHWDGTYTFTPPGQDD